MTARVYEDGKRSVRSDKLKLAASLLWKAAPILSLFVIAFFIYSVVIPWTIIKKNDFFYGRPRIDKVAFDLNPNDEVDQLTQFISVNQDRQIAVIMIPPGDVEGAQVLQGPYLFGVGQDLTVPRLRMALVNADEYPDLVLNLDNEEIIYIGENATLRLITPEERTSLVRQQPQ